MRRYSQRLLLLGALLSPASLYALGLGELKVNSALNQQFDADIELINPTTEELAGLKVSLAGAEAFERYGIDRPAFLSNFDFAITRNREGRASIKVTSNRSVTEPFVILLVEAVSGRGRLLREYSVLLDPPVFMPSQPQNQAPVATPSSGTVNNRIERAPDPLQGTATEPPPQLDQLAAIPPLIPPVPKIIPDTDPLPAPIPRPDRGQAQPSSGQVVSGGNYAVQRNDTLLRIAREVRPGAGRRALNQTMISIFNANPEAFRGNINRLRSGSVLRIPDLGEMDAISAQEATAEVVRQQQEFAGSSLAFNNDPAPNRLVLRTPEPEPVRPAPTPAPTVNVSESMLAGTGPRVPKVPPPEDNRLAIASAPIASVQQGLGPAVPPVPVPEDPEQAVVDEPGVSNQADQPPAEAMAQDQAAPPPPGPGLLDRLADFWWVPIALGLTGLLVGLVVFLRRRPRDPDIGEALDEAPIQFEPGFGQTEEREVPAPVPTRSRKRAEAFFVPEEPPPPADDFEEEAPVATARRPERIEPKTRPVAEPIFAPKIPDETLSSETAVRFDQQDALAEADFHMAYGLYDQAADLVKIAIDREPDRRELQLKLLEIYFVWGNRDLFLETARNLYDTRDQAAPGEWENIAIMGKQLVPDDPIFKNGGSGSRVDLVDVNLEGGENRVDVDLFDERQSAQSQAADVEFGSGARRAPAASNLDFLLDDDKGESSAREYDPLARTQETPTIESPRLDKRPQAGRNPVDRTAEVSLDDLGLDVESFESTESFENTTTLGKNSSNDAGALQDDEMTQLAPSLGSNDRTMMAAPRLDKFDVESTGTIYLDQVDLAQSDTVEQRRPAASLDDGDELDLDLDMLDEPVRARDDARAGRKSDAEADSFSEDVFATSSTNKFQKIDLDVGDALIAEDRAPTSKQAVSSDMALSELEPVTMSEVGTKLDLARAYMDMGDPDGARSILEEVVDEGNPTQKQEAQRLLEAVR